jgi:arylsulfatase A-like enzyme
LLSGSGFSLYREARRVKITSISERPNVLVIMADQQKATASHLYGNSFCETPALMRLAEQGVLYQHAFTPHPLCVPARISLWTGQWPHSHGGRRNETLMPTGAQHAFQLWQGAGMHTGLIGKNHCFATQEDLALFDTYCEISHRGLPADRTTKGMAWVRPIEAIDAAHAVRRQMPARNPYFSYAVTNFPLEDYSTGLVTAQTVRFLEQHQHEPFALWVSYPDPHGPIECPQAYFDLMRPRVQLPPQRAGEFDARAPERNRLLYEMLTWQGEPEEEILAWLAGYYGMTRFVDDGVGQILDALERLGLAEKTIVVFCSDHGDFAGEHGMQDKGGLFYDCLTRIPLIMAWPGHLPAGVQDASMANLVDIVPTLLHLQGMSIPRSMHGQPLPTVTDAPPRPVTFAEYGAGGSPFRQSDLEALPQPWGRQTLMQSLQWREAEGRRKMVRSARWKYVHDPMGDLDELYDLESDPWELTNVAADRANARIVAEMRGHLATWMIQTEDARPVPLP